ncbi:hypothetical protein [Alkalimonas sp.]|uniref:hypothetical protein n=1 Tax=Alkalimonas sp. TaxID=1872453 RepID=UPI00263BA370|nr:hypothetical protein [Alkalimonas sp.]MCC5827673.1 hypothetical protein [Alkalimonas sp.]
MEKFQVKIKRIFIPFLITSTVAIVIFYAIVWVFLIKARLPIAPYKDYFFMTSMALPVLFSACLFRPRLWLLQKSYGGYISNYSLYNLFIALAMMHPMMCALSYVEYSYFGLIEVEHAKEVTEYPNEQFFHINHLKIDTAKCKQHSTLTPPTKPKGYTYDFQLFYSCPIEGASDVMLAARYTKGHRTSTKNPFHHPSELSVYNAFYDFALESHQKFQRLDVNSITYLEQVKGTYSKIGFCEAASKAGADCGQQNLLFLKPQTKAFEVRGHYLIVLSIISYGVYSCIVLLMLLFSKLHDDYDNIENTTFTGILAAIFQRFQDYQKPASTSNQGRTVGWQHPKSRRNRKRRGF